MEEDILLKVKNLNVEFGKEKVVNDLSFEVRRGDFFIILGPNGAGKTTLFKSLLGLVKYSGEIIWNQKDVRIGYLPERLSRSEFKKLPISVEDFYKFKEPSGEKINKMLKSVGLTPQKTLSKNPGDLSWGQFQRMLIGWTLLKNPQVLFLDEPTTGIDIGGEKTIYSLLYKFWENKNDFEQNQKPKKSGMPELTILLITHDLNIVYGYATNVLCLHKGGVCQGPPREVLTPEHLEKLYGNKIKFYKHIR